ncbi:hypothetical protein [Bizionia sp. M204]|uniref:hypothetical protein n=1 Tax=Bizionia sp. M204 TaxID=2675331 RepID=UPI00205919C4|nr:hypothetical protein [Bizionia sp. M204]UPS92621.1 hypothetical protein GMA17_13220 [Bizionia sp. M204]
MEMVLKIKEIQIENVNISNIEIKEGEILRIQFSNLKTYNSVLSKINSSDFDGNVTNVELWAEKNENLIFIENWFNLYAKEDSFIKEMDLTGQEKFYELPRPYKNIICLKQLLENKIPALIIGTAGMHFFNLRQTYSLLHSYLKDGGICIEMTYPLMNQNELINILGVEPKVITIST